VINRGGQLEKILLDAADRKRFPSTLEEACGKAERDLIRRRKGDEGKIKTARRLRAETPASLMWIGNRPHMGGWMPVSNLLHAKPHS
jgi:hypothetical protein